MVRLDEFSLALGVIDSIVICNRHNRILFAGDDIRKRIFGETGQYADFLLENFSAPAIRRGLKSKIAEVRLNRSTCHFRFDEDGFGDTDIFIFPGNYLSPDSVILASQDRLLHANNIETALQERVKELECLYNISNELESNLDLEEALENCTGHLARGFQYPQFTTAGFLLDGHSYGDPACIPRKVENHLGQDVVIGGKKRGTISVCYHRWAEFLREEEKLLKEVSCMIAKALEKEENRRNLRSQQDLLVSKNRELVDLTRHLTLSNTNLQAVLEAITDIVVVVDRDFNITLSNKEELVQAGKCYRAVFGARDICPGCPAQKAFQSRIPETMERKHEHQYFMLQAYPIVNAMDKDRGVETVLEICSDITEKEQIKTHLIQSYKLASLGKLVAGVAHEINNPNTFIRGNMHIVQEAFNDILPILDAVHKKDPELKIARLPYEVFKEHIPVLVDDMVGGTDRIKKIVDGLRNFARKDEGLLCDDVDINLLIRNNLRITEKQIRKNARLKLDLAEGIPTFKGNIQKIEQVILNLLINATQAIDNGGGVISVTTRFTPDRNEILIEIRDNGRGMDDETSKKIFDPFFTTKRNSGGTGLGLSISYGIINEHRGRIEVQSEIGEGTAFTISIPASGPVNPDLPGNDEIPPGD